MEEEPGLLAEIEQELDTKSQLYLERDDLRAVIQAIPLVGGSLDTLIASRGRKILQRRIFYFLGSLAREMDRIEQETVDPQFFQTEQGFDLLQQALNETTETRNDSKIRLYARIVREGSTTGDFGDPLDPEAFLSIAGDLRPIEFAAGLALYEKQQVPREEDENELQKLQRVGWKDLDEPFSQLDESEIDFLISRLDSVGLMEEISGGFVGYGGGTYRTTSTFDHLVEFLGDEIEPEEFAKDSRLLPSPESEL